MKRQKPKTKTTTTVVTSTPDHRDEPRKASLLGSSLLHRGHLNANTGISAPQCGQGLVTNFSVFFCSSISICSLYNPLRKGRLQPRARFYYCIKKA